MADSEAPAPSDENGKNAIDVNEEAIREWIKAQREETQVRREELEIRRHELQLNKEQAEKSIEAQVEDRENHRSFTLEQNRTNQRYGSAVLLFILAFLGFLVWRGETQMVLELVRLAVYAGGGYYAGKKVGESSTDDAAE